MTDSENIKAFECCEANGGQSPQCDACPYHYIDENNDPCYIEVRREILKILNRQQAEIERLRKENNQFADIGKLYSEIKSEAIKEFVHEILSPFKDKVYLSKRDLEIIVNNLAKYYEQPCKRNGG